MPLEKRRAYNEPILMAAPQWESAFDVSERMVATGLVTPSRMVEARRAEQATGRLLEEILLERDLVNEEELARFFSEEFGYAYLSREDLLRSAPLPELRAVIPADLARSALLQPLFLAADKSTLDIAIAFPTNRSLLGMLQAFAACERLCIYVSTRTSIRQTIEDFYQTETPKTGVPMRRPFRAQRVLLAEPDAENRAFWKDCLERAGHHVSEVASPNAAAERIKISNFEVMVARHDLDWLEYSEIADGTWSATEIRFCGDPREALLGEVAPYPAMRSFFFGTLRALLSIFQQSHSVPADEILALPTLARTVAERLALSMRAVDEIQFAGYVLGIAKALQQEPDLLASSMERWTKSPYRIQRLLKTCTKTDENRSGSPIEARVLRVILSFFEELSARSAVTAEIVSALREKTWPEDRPVLEALVNVLYRERVTGLSQKSRQEDVLVVNKNRETLRTVELALRNEGYRSRTLTHGKDAEAEIALAPPDLLICGTSVPGVDGYTLCSWAKKRHQVPAILLSEDGGDDFSRVRASAVGAEGFFPRPHDVNGILNCAKKILDAPRAVQKKAPRCTGSLAQLGPQAIISILAANASRALIHLCSSEKSALVRFADGKPTLVENDPNTSGLKLEDVLTWIEGTFVIFDEPVVKAAGEAA